MSRYASNDVPPTDAELDQFWGKDWKPEPHDAACNAIRAIHYIDFETETAQAIIAALVDKIKTSQFTKKHTAAIESLETAFMELDK